MKWRIAIIDNGINQPYKNYLKESLTVSDKQMMEDRLYVQDKYQHGTTCYRIIRNYNINAICCSIRLLDDDGRGLVENLESVLSWCIINHYFIVNLSLGSTHFKDQHLIRNVVNSYTKSGLIIIAATSNVGLTTYPASFSSVIGVISSEIYSKIFERFAFIHLGVDCISPSIHCLNDKGETEYTQICNSYAAPYITCLVQQILENEETMLPIQKIKYLLQNQSYQTILNPDWADTVYFAYQRKNSNAEFYFKKFYDNLDFQSVSACVDTVVTDIEHLWDALKWNKNIILMGNDDEINDKGYSQENFYWSSSLRIKQIQLVDPSIMMDEISIPIILMQISNESDCFYILQMLYQYFFNDGYNAYVVSLDQECILYEGLEYIPAEFYVDSNLFRKLVGFLCGQTYFKQSDLIIIGISDSEMTQLQLNYEISVKIGKTCEDDIYSVVLSDDNSVLETGNFDLKSVYKKIVKILT